MPQLLPDPWLYLHLSAWAALLLLMLPLILKSAQSALPPKDASLTTRP
ncbi:ATP synthase F0 subunit 8 (mitochondrion) [Brachionichthys hirsutus]